MNILFLHTVAIDPSKGGIEKVTRVLADALISRRHAVFFLSMMDVFRESCDNSRQSFFPCKKIYSKENEIFTKRFLKENNINVCIFQAGDDKKVPFPHIFHELGVRLIVAVHTDPEFFRALVRGKFETKYGLLASKICSPIIAAKVFLRKIRQKRLYRKNAADAEKVVLLSEKFLPVFSKYLRNKDKEKICAIPNPRERTTKSVSLTKENEILYVGRMNLGEKRVDLLLKIWAKIQNEFPAWHLTLVGGGSDEEKIRKLSNDLKLARISFEGFQKPEKYYARASVFCLTSSFEGFGLVLVEASAFGCVPVAFNSYLSAEDIIKTGENGFLVHPFNTEHYADILRQLLRNKRLTEKISAAARINSARFSLEKILPMWEKILEK
ncbi:MAG: glycosyltransferase [Candidatus Spyradosoma sp.]